MQLFFLGINTIGLITLGLPARFPLALVGFLVVGLAAGGALAGRIPGDRVRSGSLALAAAGSILAIARAV